MIQGVVFDLDGVLVDSEGVWDQARRQVVDELGGRWHDGATAAMQGMSSVEWSAYLHNVLGAPPAPARLSELVVERVLDRYAHALPLVPGAEQVVARLGRRWPLALASSSNREVIDAVLAMSGLAPAFHTTVSSEEVPRGKPRPDVYLEAARRLGAPPYSCAAVEDSANGIRSAVAAGMVVVAVPDAANPPPPDVLERADLVVDHLSDLTVESLAVLGATAAPHVADSIDEEEVESFPASDPHADWAGPPGS